MKRFVLIFAVFVGVVSTSLADEISKDELDAVYPAVVRISTKNSVGTGFCSFDYDGRLWIASNHHVVGTEKKVKVEFFHQNRPFPVEGTVRANYFSQRPDDFSFVIVDKEDVPFDVPVLKWGGRDARPGVDALVISAGCPRGRWVFGWKGFVNAYNKNVCEFTPASIPGMSGSPLCEKINGEIVVTGIVTYLMRRNDEQGQDVSRGGAIPISHFYDALLRVEPTAHTKENGVPDNAVPLFCSPDDNVFVRYVWNHETVCQLTRPYVDSMKAKGIVFEEYPFDAKIREDWGVKNVPTFIVMRREPEEEIGRVVGLMPETQSLVESYVAKGKTLKSDGPTPVVVEAIFEKVQEPCAATTSGTVPPPMNDSFIVEAVPDGSSENDNEKKSDSSAQKEDGQVYSNSPTNADLRPLSLAPQETSFRSRSENDLDCEGFLDFHLGGRDVPKTPRNKADGDSSQAPSEKDGKSNRLFGNKAQGAFDAINNAIEQKLNEIQTFAESSIRAALYYAFWATFAAVWAALFTVSTIKNVAIPVATKVLRATLNAINIADFAQALNNAAQTTSQEDNVDSTKSKTTVTKKKTQKNGSNVKK